jgi:hypothetical protein
VLFYSIGFFIFDEFWQRESYSTVTHPESKATGPNGLPCTERTTGIL